MALGFERQPAVFVPMLPYLIKQALIIFLHLGTFKSEMIPIDWAANQVGPLKNMGLLLGSDMQSFGFFLFNILLTLVVVGGLIGIVGGLGEELGWRAFLQGRLQRKYGLRRGVLLLGVIWAYWHIPINLSGFNGASNPYMVTFLFFPVGVVGLALALGAVYLRTRSVWLCAIFHGVNNISNNLKFTTISNAVGADLLEAVILLLTGALMWVVFSKRSEAKKLPS